ncbi:Uncharacterised protein [Legionella wadsworthii]|uniref:Uncharacterized protein n=1 Tax=Legionella wadsworthii TaxID=28088 RepID=A0A378LR44_9GAMM|nr:hypothetical protein [Legionella wadsworthii]STY28318.1 Uncharacterised protein [Legionella wadsworthii]
MKDKPMQGNKSDFKSGSKKDSFSSPGKNTGSGRHMSDADRKKGNEPSRKQ